MHDVRSHVPSLLLPLLQAIKTARGMNVPTFHTYYNWLNRLWHESLQMKQYIWFCDRYLAIVFHLYHLAN